MAPSIDLISSSSASPSLPGITTSERTRSKRCARISSSARPALSHTVASCPARRKALAREASVFGSSSTIRRWLMSGWFGRKFIFRSVRKLDAKRGPAPLLALYGDPAVVVADHRLHDRQSEAGTMLFGGVVRSEQPLAFLFRQPLAG